MTRRGLFITFEGTEGAGKTTHIQRLSADLAKEGYAVCVTREPGGTPLSEKIRRILLDPEHRNMASTTELLLYAAARAQHVAERITTAIQAGKIVICSRFTDATRAYQGYGRGLDLDCICLINQIATGGLTPDLTILLDLPVEFGLDRARQNRPSLDRIEQEQIEFHRRVREGYLAIARGESNRVKRIDATQNMEQVYAQIRAEVDRKIEQMRIGKGPNSE
jgi:dTMP kinase